MGLILCQCFQCRTSRSRKTY